MSRGIWFSELVTTTSQGMLAVSYDGLAAVAIQGICEAMDEIHKLHGKIGKLNRRIVPLMESHHN